MTFQECVEFCESHKHVIGKTIGEGLIITHLVPAPTFSSNPGSYFRALYKSSFEYDKMSKSAKSLPDYEPYVLINNPADPLGLFGWYSYYFPNE